jgi:DNA-binding IclR family transcriptional regulator
MGDKGSRRNSTGLGRDLEILEALSRCDPSGAGVTRITSLLGREKTQVSRALSTLAEAGFVERDPETRAYRLGWKLHALAAQTLESRLATLAAPLLRQINLRTGASSHLFVLRGTFTAALASEVNPAMNQGWHWVDRQIPAPVTSPGRMLMSEWDPESVRLAFPDDVLAKYGENLKTTTTDKLLAELTTIRSRGYALVRQEYDLGVGCSAAVRDQAGRIVAAINVEGPPSVFDNNPEKIVEVTRNAAARLAARIGQPVS